LIWPFCSTLLKGLEFMSLRLTAPLPVALRTTVVIYALGAYKVWASERSHSIENRKEWCIFYCSKVIRGQMTPLPSPSFPQTLPIKILW
jgi:hypothetical protein